MQWPGVPTEMMKAVYGDRFFYILYFQPVGPAEAELERDPRLTMARVLYGASGDGFGGLPAELPPAAGTGFLDLMSDPPEPLPGWLTWDDIDRYADGLPGQRASSARCRTTGTSTPTTRW